MSLGQAVRAPKGDVADLGALAGAPQWDTVAAAAQWAETWNLRALPGPTPHHVAMNTRGGCLHDNTLQNLEEFDWCPSYADTLFGRLGMVAWSKS